MDSLHILRILLTFISLLAPARCWQFFTSVSDFVLTKSDPDPVSLHSEYRYGNCKDRSNQKFYVHQHLDHIEVLGKIIIRGWLNINRIPTCIILRAHSHEEDTFRATAYNFQMCVPRITYCHSKRRFKYYYYEWYIPSDYVGGMNWDLYFFGPPSAAW